MLFVNSAKIAYVIITAKACNFTYLLIRVYYHGIGYLKTVAVYVLNNAHFRNLFEDTAKMKLADTADFGKLLKTDRFSLSFPDHFNCRRNYTLIMSGIVCWLTFLVSSAS